MTVLARAAKLTPPLLLLPLLAGCFHALPRDDGGVTYATRPAFFWSMLAASVLLLVLGYFLARDDPATPEGWMLLLAATVPLAAIVIGLDNRWTVGPDEFTPPPRFAGPGHSPVRYADIQAVTIAGYSTGKGQLHDWEIRLRGQPDVLRIPRPDDPVRHHLERELRRHGIPFATREDGLSRRGLTFVLQVFAAVGAYFALAILLAACARRLQSRSRPREPTHSPPPPST